MIAEIMFFAIVLCGLGTAMVACAATFGAILGQLDAVDASGRVLDDGATYCDDAGRVWIDCTVMEADLDRTARVAALFDALCVDFDDGMLPVGAWS